MKNISILLIAVFISFGCANNNETNAQADNHDVNGLVWHINLEKAIEVAQKESKPILLQFTGSNWCGWCIKLENEVLLTKEFVDWAKDNIVLVKLDFPRPDTQTDAVKKYNRSLMNKYGVRGFPTLFLLDKDAKIILQTGYKAGGPAVYIKHLTDAYSLK
ncbi:MAG: thioredoxin family protein [Melioribacteraceae bacterium]|nr:thioredoxin family protein [Melioribacteraceae bacterium]